MPCGGVYVRRISEMHRYFAPCWHATTSRPKDIRTHECSPLSPLSDFQIWVPSAFGNFSIIDPLLTFQRTYATLDANQRSNVSRYYKYFGNGNHLSRYTEIPPAEVDVSVGDHYYVAWYKQLTSVLWLLAARFSTKFFMLHEEFHGPVKGKSSEMSLAMKFIAARLNA